MTEIISILLVIIGFSIGAGWFFGFAYGYFWGSALHD